MDLLMGGLAPWAFALSCGVMLLAGFTKGAIGFAMPMVAMALLPTVMPVQMALAALIIPVLVTNVQMSLRQGVRPALDSGRRFWRIIAMTALGIAISAPFVVLLPQQAMFLMLGATVLLFSAVQFSGWTPDIPPRLRNPVEYAMGLAGGLFGGVSGIWGPLTVTYLLAIRVEKREMLRVMSVVFTLGAVVFTLSHLRSGVLNVQTGTFSAVLLIPSVLGMWLGYMVQDRLDQALFRRLTILMLCLTALNLLRRGLMG